MSKTVNTQAPVREIVAALARHSVPLCLIGVVFDNVCEYLQNMEVRDPNPTPSGQSIAGGIKWKPPTEHPREGESIIVALSNGQIREARYQDAMYSPFNMMVGELMNTKVAVIGWASIE